MSKSDEQKLAALVKKTAAKVEAKRKIQRRRDSTLSPETTDEDIARRDFFSEMQKRDF